MIDYLEAALEREDEAEDEDQEAWPVGTAPPRGAEARGGRSGSGPEPEARPGAQIDGGPEVRRAEVVAPCGTALQGRGAWSGGVLETAEGAAARVDVDTAPERRRAEVSAPYGAELQGRGAWSGGAPETAAGAAARVDMGPEGRPAGGVVPAGAAWLYAGLARGQAAAEVLRRERAVTVSIPAESGQAPAAAVAPGELDRCFQRDARRYDGGFTLF